MKNNSTAYDHVRKGIEKIMKHGGKNNIMRIELQNDYYIQLLCEIDSNEILFEAVSNYFIEDSNKLTESEIGKMKQIGWELPKNENENFSIEAKIENEEDIKKFAEVIIQTTSDVYKVEAILPQMIGIELDN